MSSIYKDQWEKEAREEIEEFLEKKAQYGWTQKDAERYQYLLSQLGE